MILTKVLKEWSSALKFYENKKVCLIFRKGGIHEKDFIETKDFFGFSIIVCNSKYSICVK